MKTWVAKNRRPIGITLFVVLSILFIVLLILPANYFDTGRATCLSVIFFEMECYGCGMTRAIQHLIHLDFKEAYEFNKLSFIVFPLAVGMILWEINRMVRSKE